MQDLQIQITKKRIKNLNMRVYPDGRIKVSAPFNLSDKAINSFIMSKISWIRKRKAKFPKKPEYLSEETHYFLGKTYKLKIILTGDAPKVKLKEEYIELYVKPESDKEKILFEFYKLELKERIPLFIEKWEKIIGKEVKDFRIRRMKTRWGSCNFKERIISINSELAKRPLHFLEYVIVHEMVHLIEKSHNRKFYDLMTIFLPEWKRYRKELKTII